uniref:Uncharacterized protein n=1 Tax=Anguilla anguilla TaxID=7936 RepID=A0A0E9PBZ5_ANGAN
MPLFSSAEIAFGIRGMYAIMKIREINYGWQTTVKLREQKRS